MQRLQAVKNCIAQKQFVYSVPVGPVRKGQTRVHRHPASKDGLLQIPKHIKNLADFWDDILKKYSNNKAVQDLTYKELDNLVRPVGSWFLENKHTRIYLYAKNSVQWTITDLASWNYGLINVPLYDTLGSQAFFHILKLTEGTCICLTNDLADNLHSYLSNQKQKVNTVIFFDTPSAQNIKKLENLGLKTLKFKDLLSYKVIARPTTPHVDTHLTYSFTSGTTGLPKGVIKTHRSLMYQCSAMKGHYEYNQKDVHLSFLPIAHTFERFMTWTILYFGGNIRYSQFPITQLPKDLARAKPTTLGMVPRLLNKFYPICKGIYQRQKSYAKVKGLFGGRVRLVVTGSAPISPQILTFFRVALDCDVREGYGQTETTAASFVTYQGDTNYGHVGGPNRVTQFKLVDIPEMNYLTTSNPPQGQICTRGHSVFKGYYLDQKNTKQTIDQEGWNHSGDVGIILPNGALKIIDRKKNIYKLSQGEYISPQKVQNIYVRNPYVAECFLYGDSLQNFNVAIIHPNLQTLAAAAKKMGIQETDPEKLVKNKKVQQFVLKETTQQAKRQGLFGFQMPKKIRLWPVSFGTYGIFTSTMKLQRHIAKNAFIKQIEQMYKQN